MMETTFGNYTDKLKRLSISNSALSILILANLAITIPLAIKLGVWVDEAFTLQTTTGSIGFTLQRALKFELQAPLFFILLNLWRSFNDSIFFARLFSIICIVISIFVSVRVSARYFREISPLYFASVIALNPFTIWAALEIRRYAFVVLLTALLFLFFYDAFIREQENKRAKFFYTITAIVGLYTQYYFGMLLAAHAFAILGIGNFKRLNSFVLQMLIAGLVFSPMLLVVLDQMSGMPTMGAPSIDIPRIFKVLQTIAENFIIPMDDLPLNRFGRWMVRILAILTILAACLKMGNKKIIKLLDPAGRIAIFTVFALLIQFATILFFVREELLNSRHVSFFLVPSLVLVFSVLNISRDKKLLKSWVFVLICLYSIALFQSYKVPAKIGDFKRIASYIMNNEKPGEPILIFPQENALPLKFHYSGSNILVPIPNKDGQDSTDGGNFVLNNVLNNESEIMESLSVIKGKPEALWVVRYPHYEYLGVKFNIEIFDKFIEKNYYIQTSKAFFKDVQVMRVEKKHKLPGT